MSDKKGETDENKRRYLSALPLDMECKITHIEGLIKRYHAKEPVTVIQLILFSTFVFIYFFMDITPEHFFSHDTSIFKVH